MTISQYGKSLSTFKSAAPYINDSYQETILFQLFHFLDQSDAPISRNF